MTLRTFTLTICFAALAAGVVLAQPPATAQPQRVETPKPAADQPPPTPVSTAIPVPRRQGQPVNIRVDVTITDQRGGTAALKKTVSVVTGDAMSGYIRSTANYSNIGDVPLNVDTEPEILSDGKVRVRVNLQYDLPGGVAGQSTETPGAGSLRRTQIRENLAVILESGKAVTVAQSADPVGDRQVTIDIKATILR